MFGISCYSTSKQLNRTLNVFVWCYVRRYLPELHMFQCVPIHLISPTDFARSHLLFVLSFPLPGVEGVGPADWDPRSPDTSENKQAFLICRFPSEFPFCIEDPLWIQTYVFKETRFCLADRNVIRMLFGTYRSFCTNLALSHAATGSIGFAPRWRFS